LAVTTTDSGEMLVEESKITSNIISKNRTGPFLRLACAPCWFSSHPKLGDCVCHRDAMRVLCHYLLAQLFGHFSAKHGRLKKIIFFLWPSWGFKLWYGKWGDCSKL